MIRLALPKGRNLGPTLDAFRAAGLDLSEAVDNGRKLRAELPDAGVEVLFLKDWDLPLYVEHGIADCGVVGSDVLAEQGSDLLVPLRLAFGHSRLCLIGLPGTELGPGDQVRLATKFPELARRYVAEQPWGAEILKLHGSIELAPLLELSDVILDIVQTGRTLEENGLVELETVDHLAPCLVIHRAAYQEHRQTLNDLIGRLEAAEVAS